MECCGASPIFPELAQTAVPVWTQTEGEPATIANPVGVETGVTVPGTGVFGFRLSTTLGSVTFFDDVTIAVGTPALPQSPFQVWLRSFGLDPANGVQLLNSDIDSDGVSVLFEFAHGGRPDSITRPPSLEIDLVEKRGRKRVSVSYDRLVDHETHGLTYEIEMAESPRGEWRVVELEGVSRTGLSEDGSLETMSGELVGSDPQAYL